MRIFVTGATATSVPPSSANSSVPVIRSWASPAQTLALRG